MTVGKMVWVCNCGCVTGVLYASGEFVCANCDAVADASEDIKLLDRSDIPRIAVERKDAFKIVDMNTTQAAFDRIVRNLQTRRDEVVGFFVMYANGQSSNWYDLEGDKQCDWAIAGLEDQKEYINAKFRDKPTVQER